MPRVVVLPKGNAPCTGVCVCWAGVLLCCRRWWSVKGYRGQREITLHTHLFLHIYIRRGGININPGCVHNVFPKRTKHTWIHTKIKKSNPTGNRFLFASMPIYPIPSAHSETCHAGFLVLWRGPASSTTIAPRRVRWVLVMSWCLR